jgi:hypothetical protein
VAARSEISADFVKMHVDLLKALNGLEARCLCLIFGKIDEFTSIAYLDLGQWESAVEKFNTHDGLENEKLRVSLLNLQRLGIISPKIDETDILEMNSFDEWRATVNKNNLLDEFKKITANLVFSLTNLTGSPLNDTNVEQANLANLVLSYAPTRIGWSIYYATDESGMRNKA